MRHVVVDVTSWRARLRSETRVDKGLRYRLRNTPSHLSITLRGDFRIRMLKVNVPHPFVVFGRELLGELIGKVFSSLLPVEAELVLLDAAAHTVEMNVKIFGVLLAHVAVKDAMGGRAVGLDWGGRLQVTHFDEGRADGNSLLAVEENRSSFGLCGGIHYSADGLTLCECWSIRGGSRTDVGRW